MPLKDWKPVDWIIVMIIILIGFVLVATGINVIVNEAADSPTREKLVGTITLSLIAIISIYIGSKLNNKNDEKD